MVEPVLWVPAAEAVRMIARLLTISLGEAALKLIDALRTGRVASRGWNDSEPKIEAISRLDWMRAEDKDLDLQHNTLREPGRRVTRYMDIEISVAEITGEFGTPPKATPPPVRPGRKYGHAPEKMERVKAEMLAYTPADLKAMKVVVMSVEFNAGRTLCADARKAVLSELPEIETTAELRQNSGK